MSYTVLARKYRPQRFADVIGQEHVTRTLKNALEQGRVAHGYIFSGHRGIGKTTVARILAMALNCRSQQHPVAEPCGECESCTEIRAGNAIDVIEIDAATNRGIDEIRELRDAARYRPARDRYKIYILDEAHQITDAAFNALLKTLEEPPGHIVFMMATTEPEDIPQTIRSRCQHFSFHAVRFDDIMTQLRAIAAQEGIAADEDALTVLAEAGDGSMRDALSIMDQAIACCGQHLTGLLVRQLVGSVPSEMLERVMEAVSGNSSQEVLRIIDRLMVEGQSPTHFARQMLRFLRNTLVAKVAGAESPLLQSSSDERARVGRIAALFSEEDLTRFLQILLRTHSELGYKQEQRFHLELGLLKLVHAQRLLPIEQLLSEAAAGAPAPTWGSTPRSPSSSSVPSGSTAPPTRAVSPTPQRRPSPLENDVARKGTPRSELSPGTSGGFASSAAAAAAPAPEQPTPEAPPSAAPVSPLEVEPAMAGSSSSPANSAGDIPDRVLQQLEKSGQKSLPSMLEDGAWRLEGNQLTVQVPSTATMIDLTVNAEAQALLNQLASAAAGRPLRVKVVSGAVSQSRPEARPPAPASGTFKARALRDPVVRKMQEKFQAQICTVMDSQKI